MVKVRVDFEKEAERVRLVCKDPVEWLCVHEEENVCELSLTWIVVDTVRD